MSEKDDVCLVKTTSGLIFNVDKVIGLRPIRHGDNIVGTVIIYKTSFDDPVSRLVVRELPAQIIRAITEATRHRRA